MTVLEIFMAMWTARIPTSVLEYVEAVNTFVDLRERQGADNVIENWAAVIAPQDAVRVDVTLGSKPWVEEAGTIAIGLFTKSGKGPAALNTAVDYIRQSFHGARQDGLLILNVDGPLEVDPEGAGEFWQLAMQARYIYQTRRDASQPGFGDWQGFPQVPPAPLPGP